MTNTTGIQLVENEPEPLSFGGEIAHEFNNLLAVILGSSHFLLEALGEDDPRRDDAKEIVSAAERAASLTQKLQASARRQILVSFGQGPRTEGRGVLDADERVSPLSREPSRGRVLIIDDERSVLRTYAQVLRRAGYSVDAMSDGGAATTALASGVFDVIVSDVGLPDMDGIAVLRAAHGFDPDLPVVLMTGSADLASAVQAVEHGALRYLLKPIASSALEETVAVAVRLRREARYRRDAVERYGLAAKESSDIASLTAQLGLRLDRAIAEIWVAYQPIVRWSTREVYSYEALVRTGEPSMARPDHLFEAAERLGRVHELGRAIRREVARAVGVADPGICTFVNVHPHDLLDEDLLSPDAPLSRVASRVVLEVTERSSLNAIEDFGARLDTLRALGFRLAIDDLGAGYSGLTSFIDLRPDMVKLDMALTRGIDRDPTRQKLARTMVDLCRDLGVEVIAEGIETTGERDALVSLGCDLLQGFLFARPGAPYPEVVWHRGEEPDLGLA